MFAIERAGVQDAEEILELQKLAYISEAAIYNDFSIPPLKQSLNSIRAQFKQDVFLKAVSQKIIIGSVRASIKGETCYIGRLIVHPQDQDQGVGQRLMKEIEKAQSAPRYELFTGNKSEKNLYLYRKLGYREFRRETMNDRLTLVYMEKFHPGTK